MARRNPGDNIGAEQGPDRTTFVCIKCGEGLECFMSFNTDGGLHQPSEKHKCVHGAEWREV